MNQLQEYLNEHPDIVLSKGSHVSPECGQCVLELCSQVLGKKWTDKPEVLGLPDIRPLHDALWSSDALRTEHMLRVGVAVWSWRGASKEQRVAFSGKLAELTIRRVLPLSLRAIGLDAAADMCEREGTADAAYAAEAAYAATEAVTAADAYAARAASEAAAAAAEAAYVAAAEAAYVAATEAAAEVAYAAAEAAYAARAAAYAAAAVEARAADAVEVVEIVTAAADAADAAADNILITACDCWVEAAQELLK